MKDYYKILGVPENATQEEIRKRYRELVKKYHPDINKDNPEAAKKMAEINEAYQVLSDPKKRAQYDAMRRGGFSGTPGGSYTFDDIFGGGFEDISSIFGDLFGAFFGTPETMYRQKTRRTKGRNVKVRIEIPLKLAIEGGTTTVTVKRPTICKACGGTGAKDPNKIKTCPTCGGTGYVRRTQTMGFMTFSTTTVCPTCHGKGKIIEEPCPVCRGQGVVSTIEDITIHIPPGVRSGDILTVRGKGEEIPGGLPGDLLVEVHVDTGDFEIRGDDIITYHYVPYPFMILGGKTKVKTPTEKIIEVDIKPGSSAGDVISIPGEGYTGRYGRRGHLKVVLVPELPKKVSVKEKELLMQIAELYRKNNQEGGKSTPGGFLGGLFRKKK